MLFIHLPVDGPLDCFQFWLIMNEAVRNRHFPLPLKYPYASLSYFLPNSVPMSSIQKGLLWLLYLKWHFPLLSRPFLHFILLLFIYFHVFLKFLYLNLFSIFVPISAVSQLHSVLPFYSSLHSIYSFCVVSHISKICVLKSYTLLDPQTFSCLQLLDSSYSHSGFAHPSSSQLNHLKIFIIKQCGSGR